jgi:hypothetical protein
MAFPRLPFSAPSVALSMRRFAIVNAAMAIKKASYMNVYSERA